MMLSFALLAVTAVGHFAQANPDYRVSLDIPFKADLRRARGVTFDFRISDVKQCSQFSFYFKSGNGWYSAGFTPKATGGWERVEIGRDRLHQEGKVGGWKNVEAVRVSGGRTGTTDVTMDVENVAVWDGEADFLSVSGLSYGLKNPQHKDGLAEYGGRGNVLLRSFGLKSALVDDVDLDADLLKGVKALFFPYNPAQGESLYALLETFVAKGGKIFASHTGDQRLIKLAKKSGGFSFGQLWVAGDMPPENREKFRSLVRQALPGVSRELDAGLAAERRRDEEEIAWMKTQPTGPADEFRAFWCHSAKGLGRGHDWDSSVAFLKRHGFNTMIANLAWGGCVAYPSDRIAFRSDLEKGRDYFAECAAACRKHGVGFHVWKVCWSYKWGTPKEEVEKMRLAGRLVRTVNGQEEKELCPSHPDNIRHEIDTFVEIARKRPDGIHFDYVRYPDSRTCFCDGCRRRFEAAVGRKVDGWPQTFRQDPALAKAWREFRCSNVTALVRGVAEEVRRVAPGVKISAAVFEDFRSTPDTIGQDWKRWSDEGFVDFVCPMDYTDSGVRFARLMEHQAEINRKTPVYPGIGLSSTGAGVEGRARRVAEQIALVRQHGYRGFTVFNFDGSAIEVLPKLVLGPTRPEAKIGTFSVLEVGPDIAPTNRIVRRVDVPPIVIPKFAEDVRALGTGGLTPVDGHSGSFAFLAVVEPKTRRGVVAGWLTNEKASGVIQSGFDEKGNVVLKPFAEYGRMEVPANAGVRRDLFVHGFFEDCRLGLEAYADAIAAHYAIRLPKQISGYTTWYDDVHGYSHREGAGTAASAQAFADAVKRTNLKAYGLDFYQIDDFWQSGSDKINGPARDFFHVNPKGPFPDGFKATTAYFAERDMIAGLWIMPFGGLSKEPFFADKQDIFARAFASTPAGDANRRDVFAWRAKPQKAGEPFETIWGGTIIDLSKASGLAYVSDLCRLVTYDWGFRYIKFDGMWMGHGGDLHGGPTWRNDHYDNIVREDRACTGVEAFRRGVGAMRAASVPGTFLLACNSAQSGRSIAASYGLIDGMRIGGDNGPIDEFPERYMQGPIAATPRYFYNGRVWYNDPDPIYVRDAVPLNRARLFASWGGVSSLLYNFSDCLPNLSEERVELLRRTMAPHGIKACRPVDYFENLTSYVWEVGEEPSKVFGLFNWETNRTLKVDYPAAYCGLDPAKRYVAFDFWRNELLPEFAGRFVCEVPADDCRVLAVHERLDRPFVLSTSRHVASPLFDVREEKWDAATRTLSGVSKVVPGEKYEIRVFANGKLHRFAFNPTQAEFAWHVKIDG